MRESLGSRRVGQRDDSVFKRTGCSSTGPDFTSQHPTWQLMNASNPDARASVLFQTPTNTGQTQHSTRKLRLREVCLQSCQLCLFYNANKWLGEHLHRVHSDQKSNRLTSNTVYSNAFSRKLRLQSSLLLTMLTHLVFSVSPAQQSFLLFTFSGTWFLLAKADFKIRQKYCALCLLHRSSCEATVMPCA